MRRSVKIGFILVLVFSLTAVLMLGCAAEEEPAEVDLEGIETIELSVAHMWPAVHPKEEILVQGWIEAVEEATDGLVTGVSYPGATLTEAGQEYEAAASGIADIGFGVFGYDRGRFPLLEVFELPGIIYNDAEVASYVLRDAIEQFQPEEIMDTKMLLVYSTGPGHLYTKEPVETLEDLQGMEIRGFGRTVDTLDALGAVPTAMPQADAYEAIDRGVVSGNLAPLEVLEGWNQAEVTDYITMTPFLYNATFFFTMNLDVWNDIPTELQDIIEEVNEEFFVETASRLFLDMNESALNFAVEETGQEIIELSDEEQERWLNKVRPLLEEWVTEMEAEGLPAREIYELTLELADKYNEEFR